MRCASAPILYAPTSTTYVYAGWSRLVENVGGAADVDPFSATDKNSGKKCVPDARECPEMSAQTSKVGGSQSQPRRKGTRSWAFNVAGVTFRQRESLGFVRMARECPPEMRLSLEPNNAHDPNAVRVEGIMQGWCCKKAEYISDSGRKECAQGGVKVPEFDCYRCPEHGDAVRVPRVHQCGYVPREFAPWVAALLKQGRVVEVKLVSAGTLQRDPDVPWLRVRMEYRA